MVELQPMLKNATLAVKLLMAPLPYGPVSRQDVLVNFES